MLICYFLHRKYQKTILPLPQILSERWTNTPYHTIKKLQDKTRQKYGRGSDGESNDGHTCLPVFFLAVSRGAWTVAGGNLCSVTLRQEALCEQSFLLIGAEGEKTRAYECVRVRVCVCLSQHTRMCEREEEEEADCENETVTRESWKEGCRERA